MPDPTDRRALTRGEWLNVMFVAAASQIAQILMVAVVTAAIFFTLGLLVLSRPILADWTKGAGSVQGTVLGMTLPVPQALIHVTMFVGAMTFMYISSRTVSDADYRTRFFDPLIDDVRVTLVARNRYRAAVSAR
jgi:hypothetical protein